MTDAPVVTCPIDVALARRVLEVVDVGLSKGLGSPNPGTMCVEAAVCFAMGLPHGDNPPCVDPVVRGFKIALNDKDWSTPAARAHGLRKLAVAQLGSKGTVSGRVFTTRLAELTIRRIVPVALRAAAAVAERETQRQALEAAAVRCETEGTSVAAKAAYTVAADAYAYANAAVKAAYAASASADAAAKAATAYAAYAAANAAYAATAYAANAAASASADAADNAAAYAADAADNAAFAANAAGNAAAGNAAARDRVLTLSADIAVEVLREMSAPGIALMDEVIA